jgi:hypothetical protein
MYLDTLPMNNFLRASYRPLRPQALVALCVLTFVPSLVHAADRRQPPTNIAGAPVLDANGQRINYGPKEDRAATSPASGATKHANWAAYKMSTGTSGVAPAVASESRPFWQYAIFGSGIGASNIVIGPAPVGGGTREILVGCNSRSNFGGDDFWQALRFNPAMGDYDQVFVSPIYSDDYSGSIRRIGIANVLGNSNPEIVVVLGDGRIYVYDFATKTELGHIDSGVSGFEGLSLTDVNGDGHADLIVTTANDLFVADGTTGELLWYLAGAGGYDVVAGQMDNDAAIEIAVTSGKVVDAGTHTVQWTRNGGFGAHLRLAPFQGESYQQLIVAESWHFVYAYDVARQLPRWSINTPEDIGAIQMADVDGDGRPEVIIGDGQWGEVHVHDLITQARKWAVANPEHGVTNIAVGDVDGDGVVDLLWGAGYTSSGANHLYVASTTGSHTIKWQSLDLGGPFLGPLIGDLDGDGQPELVVCSSSSNAGYDSGRILVFDLATLTLRGISAPVANNFAWTGVHDLKLTDLEGDGSMEIVIATDYLYDGAIEIYGFNSSNTFALKWANTTRPSASPFSFVEVADLDGNGTPEIIAGNIVAHSGSPGVYVYIYNYPSGADPWRSVNMAGGVAGLVVKDLDGNGSKEIAALAQNGDFYTFDGPSRQLRNLRQSTGFTLLSGRSNPSGLVTSDSAGTGHFLKYANSNYTEPVTIHLGEASLDGISGLPSGALWTGSTGLLTLRLPPLYNTVTWQSPAIGSGFGHSVATDVRYGQNRVFSSAQHAVVGLIYPPLAHPVGDFNGDSFTDYLLFDPSARRTAIWNLQGNAFLSGIHGPTLPAGWAVACVADLNLDGKPDYVLFKASTRQTAIWFLNNNVYTGSVFGPTLPAGWTLIAATDFNHDGHPDYVLFNASTRRTAIWFLNNNVYTGSVFGPTLPPGWILIDSLDLNGNGRPDFLLSNASTRQTAFWYLNGTSYFSSVNGPTLPFGWTLQGSADFNGDAKPDYVLFKASTRQTVIWYLNGATYVSGASGPTLAAGYVLASP